MATNLHTAIATPSRQADNHADADTHTSNDNRAELDLGPNRSDSADPAIIHDGDFTDVAQQRATERAEVEHHSETHAAEPAPPDIREQTQHERVNGDHEARVPDAEQTADAVQRARRALLEIRARHQADQEHDRERHLADWHCDDQTSADGDVDEDQA